MRGIEDFVFLQDGAHLCDLNKSVLGFILCMTTLRDRKF